MKRQTLVITNPKRTKSQTGRSNWYPYYAGFSYDFAHKLLRSAELPKDALVLDDWNGSGTTTSVASALGYRSFGFDLNPAMAIIAKARLMNKRERSSVQPLAAEVIQKAYSDKTSPIKGDPLRAWFKSDSAHHLRKLERAIQLLLLDHNHYDFPATRTDFLLLSGIGAFLYLALFRTVRSLIARFVPSNPTWVRTPRNLQTRLRPQVLTVFEIFQAEALAMIHTDGEEVLQGEEFGQASIKVAASESLPLPDACIQFALGSPPYCTRIDYAIATKPELAILGYNQESFSQLRRGLLGTSTVPRIAPIENQEWGWECLTFLGKLKTHRSKASETYYYKNHLQYFDGIFRSLGELRRVLKKNGTCVLVVQDSYYKDVRNDLPGIVTEMAAANGLALSRQENFTHDRTMAVVNPSVRQYRSEFKAIESVLVFNSAA